MVSGESTKLGKEIGQLKQLLAQKEAAIKRLQSRKYERRNDKTLQLQELKEQLDRLSN
jgi:Mg2+ and Co2+ transporter CorA